MLHFPGINIDPARMLQKTIKNHLNTMKSLAILQKTGFQADLKNQSGSIQAAELRQNPVKIFYSYQIMPIFRFYVNPMHKIRKVFLTALQAAE